MSGLIDSPQDIKATASVVIAVPCGDDVKAGMAHDLAVMLGQTVFNRPDIQITLRMDKGTLLPSQRSTLVREALGTGATHILFLDSDMRFPPETMVGLLARKVPIVAANYVTRRFPIQPVAFKSLDDDVVSLESNRVWTEKDSTGLQSVGAIGMGVMLIDLDVFRYLEEPWFNIDWIARDPEGKKASGFRGEDMHFCDLARKAGIEVLVDHDLSQYVRHVGAWDYAHDHALTQRDAIEYAEACARDNQLLNTPVGGSQLVVPG